MAIKKWGFILGLVILFISCKSVYTLRNYELPKPVDTKTQPISYQEKKIHQIGNVFVRNDFPSARMNGFEKINEDTYQILIKAENYPINNSPWYAFKIWSSEEAQINLVFKYEKHKHRYHPKISSDGENWEAIPGNEFKLFNDDLEFRFPLSISSDTAWIAAQEIQDSKKVIAWTKDFGKHSFIKVSSLGKSVQGRDLIYMDINQNPTSKKPLLVILSRQHPPEVTGYFAMQRFVERIVDSGKDNGFLKKYRVLVYPLLNPDGVDLGHYRHNTGGIDLNRDWAEYNQPEIKQIANHIVAQAKAQKNDVQLGLDFHSTHKDVYYTFDNSVKRKLPGFTKKWLEKIRVAINLEDINEKPSGFGSPVSKAWFNKQFGAESITYEIGDDTPRAFIKIKGEVSADAMMELLLEE